MNCFDCKLYIFIIPYMYFIFRTNEFLYCFDFVHLMSALILAPWNLNVIIMQLLTQYELPCTLIGSLHIYCQFIVCIFTIYGAVQI